MRQGHRLLLAAVAAGWFCCASVTPAGAQQPPAIDLHLSVDQAMLMVETLKAIRCDTVQQWIVCEKARALLEAIQTQAKAQVK